MRFLAFATSNPTPCRGMGHVAGAADLHNQDYARALLAWYDRERRILVARRLDERRTPLAELAAELGVSRERVRQVELKTKQFLHRYLTPDERDAA